MNLTKEGEEATSVPLGSPPLGMAAVRLGSNDDAMVLL